MSLRRRLVGGALPRSREVLGRRTALTLLVVCVTGSYAATAVMGIAALVASPSGGAGLVAVTAAMVATTEVDKRRLRLEWRESRCNHDIQSVWLMLAVVVLPLPVAGLVVLTGYGHRYLRLPQGVEPARLVYNLAAIGISVAASARVLDATDAVVPGPVPSPLSLAAAGAVFFVVNLALVLAHLILTTGAGTRELLGSPGKYTIEALTIGLGLSFGAGAHAAGLSVLLFGAPAVFLLQQALAAPALKQAALTDAKTGLLSAGAWKQLAARDWLACERARSPVTVLFIDLDHFKAVNDTYGHLAGDQVLIAAADAVRGACRPADTVGRFGGEEFVIVACDVNEDEALRLAERLRVAVADSVVGPRGISVTASVGAAVAATPSEMTLDEALHAADLACYSAKTAGRNQVRMSSVGLRLETPPPVPAAARSEAGNAAGR